MKYLLRSRPILALLLVFSVLTVLFLATMPFYKKLAALFAEQRSVEITDRNGEFIAVLPNKKEYYNRTLDAVSEEFQRLLIKKEDRFFFYHPGFNPLSVLRGGLRYILTGSSGGTSTISQQLAKILLGNENERTLKNKIVELWYAIALELHAAKQEIFSMYASSVYFGKQTQGIEEASRYYFGKPAAALNNEEILSLLATISNPSRRYPGSITNIRNARALANALNARIDENILDSLEKNRPEKRFAKTFFEISSLNQKCENSCRLTIDAVLTEQIRGLLEQNLENLESSSVKNGAAVVIKLPENEILALVGSPNPGLDKDGFNINMAIRPRPIGSTAKPFFYAKAFKKGARPYTLVEDREYKYEIGTGYPLYPKNFDGKYRGIVTLHEALSNSLNVPSIKVLEYAGLEDFYGLLSEDLSFRPVQPLEEYALGIALGALEADLLTLSHYFTIFPGEGELKPMKLIKDGGSPFVPPMENGYADKKVFPEEIARLINKILSDRKTGVDQFGIKSELNIPYADNYALKTGTSYDFHDSWVVGYTPDFLVGVWVGNSDNTPMRNVTGQSGAGKIWHEIMELMLHSEYGKNTPFDFGGVREYMIEGSLEFGLADDDPQAARALLLDELIIIFPFDNDVMALEENTIIPLRSSFEAEWFINGKYAGSGESFPWRPEKSGRYIIKARLPSGETRAIKIIITENEEKI